MEERIGRALAAWVEGVARHPWATLALGLLVTIACGLYTVEYLRIDMSVDAMMSQELPGQRRWREINESFPETTDPLLIVVDAPTPERARDAALLLQERLAREVELFRRVELPGEEPFFARNGLLYLSTDELAALADRLALAQPYLAELQRDPSLVGLFALLRRGLDAQRSGEVAALELAPVFAELARGVDAARAGASAPASWRELLLGKALPDAPRRVLMVEPIVDYRELVPARAIIERVHELAREIGLERDSGVRVRVTGELALSADELDTVTRGTAVSGLISFVAVTAILIFGLRSWQLVLATAVSLLAGLVWTFAFTTAAIGSLNMVSVAFAVLFIGLGDDFAVHFCFRWRDLRAHGHGPLEAMRDTAADVGLSLFVCAATTAVGFLAFAPTDYAGVAHLGVISAAGIVISLVTSLTLLPAFIAVLRPPYLLAPTRLTRSAWFQSLVDLPLVHGRALRFGALGLFVACLPVLPFARFEYNPLRLRVADADSVTAFNDLLADPTLSPWSVTLLARDGAAADRAASALRSLDSVAHALTLSDYVPEQQEAKLAILEDVALFMAPAPRQPPSQPDTEAVQRALASFAAASVAPPATASPAQREALARLGAALAALRADLEQRSPVERAAVLERLDRNLVSGLPRELERIRVALAAQPIDADSLPPELLRRTVTSDGRVRVDAWPREDLGETGALLHFADATTAVEPEVTGLAITTAESGRVVVRAFQEALAGAALAVAVLLFLLWRRPLDTLIALAPLALATALITALCALADFPFNFANVLVLPALLGIGVNSGIHLVHRWRHADPGNDDLLHTSTARGVVQSTLTTIASFGGLAVSVHPGMSSLGMLLAFGLSLILISNLLLIPALVAGRRVGAVTH